MASLAVAAGRQLGLPDEQLVTLRRAALIHDIGRNGVPNSIWDKPAPLTDSEIERVRLHAYYTDRVVHRAGRLALLASIASAAHERHDGSGYPRGAAGGTVSLLGRLLAAADVYGPPAGWRVGRNAGGQITAVGTAALIASPAVDSCPARLPSRLRTCTGQQLRLRAGRIVGLEAEVADLTRELNVAHQRRPR